MTDVACPWCEEPVEVSPEDACEEQTCPACCSTWAYEALEGTELPLAA